jgi:antitoxin component YwqK of YwqJK toxin-antitoxin module
MESGASKSFYKSGELMTEEVYNNGQLNGTVHLYNKNGNLAYIDTYQNGIKLSRQTSSTTH